MRKLALLSSPFFVFAMVATAFGATVVIITGIVMGEITVPTEISYGSLKLNQDVTRVLVIVGSPLTQPITVNSTCESPGTFSATVNMPIGSTSPTVAFINNGTTVLNPNITAGNITLGVRGVSQGRINCTLVLDATNQTNVTVVSGGFS